MTAAYYVYELADPRDGGVFYVGKGSSNRVDQHEVDARNGQPGPRCDFIRLLQAENLEPEKRIVRRFATEEDAYRAETALIERYGRDNLTNMVSGHSGQPCDDQWRNDRDLARELVKIGIKTNGFEGAQTFTFGGARHHIQDAFFDMCRRELGRIVRQRGMEWVFVVAWAHPSKIGFVRWQRA